MSEVQQGRIISYTSHVKLARDGWAVQFRYDCECGVVHETNKHGVWPRGDVLKETVRIPCPVSDKITSVELVRPNPS